MAKSLLWAPGGAVWLWQEAAKQHRVCVGVSAGGGGLGLVTPSVTSTETSAAETTGLQTSKASTSL